MRSFSSGSARRPAIPTRQPAAIHNLAISIPIPEVAPMITIRFAVVFIIKKTEDNKMQINIFFKTKQEKSVFSYSRQQKKRAEALFPNIDICSQD